MQDCFEGERVVYLRIICQGVDVVVADETFNGEAVG